MIRHLSFSPYNQELFLKPRTRISIHRANSCRGRSNGGGPVGGVSKPIGPGVCGILHPNFREHSADCEVRPKRMNAAPGRSDGTGGEEEISSAAGYYVPVRGRALEGGQGNRTGGERQRPEPRRTPGRGGGPGASPPAPRHAPRFRRYAGPGSPRPPRRRVPTASRRRR